MIKVLVVDDEVIIREGIVSMLPLKELNMTLTASCGDAIDALNSMLDNLPDILITDIKMAGMDGLMLIEQAQQLNPALHSIIISGYDDFSFARKAIKLGVKEYLLKPFSEDELREPMERICKEIMASRERSERQIDARSEAVSVLAEKMNQIMPDKHHGKITPEQIRSIVEPVGDVELLRAAYIYLITRQEVNADKGYAAICRAYEISGNWYELIADGLNNLLPQHGQYRKCIQQVCDYISENYMDTGLSLQYVADHVVHMRADYLGREFTKDTGMKFSAWLLQIRMEKAKELLLFSTEENYIYEVAEKIGLGHNPRYFSQLFKKYTGMSPREYGTLSTDKQ